jgi:hypothetical protein
LLLAVAGGRTPESAAVRSDAAEHSDAAGAHRIDDVVAAEKSVQEEVNEGAMSEKSLRAKAIPVLRLRVRTVRPCGNHWGRPGVGKRARMTRNEATKCTMPTGWELKMEIPG